MGRRLNQGIDGNINIKNLMAESLQFYYVNRKASKLEDSLDMMRLTVKFLCIVKTAKNWPSVNYSKSREI